MSGRQEQQAGDHSQQLQVAGDVHYHQGVTEQRAAEIAEYKAEQAISRYTAEAGPIAAARVKAFDETLVKHFAREELLDAFKDPSFQILLLKAQMGAASTDREDDYELLSRLLSERATQQERRHKASIDRAVQVVDHLDESALQGLTISWCITQFTPMSGFVGQGLDVLESLYAQYPTDDLPLGADWLDHLDTLDAVRITPNVSTLKPLTTFWSEKMRGYVVPGFDDQKAQEIIGKCEAEDVAIHGLPIVEHELRAGFKRLAAVNEPVLRDLAEKVNGVTSDRVERLLTIARDDAGLGQVHGDALDNFERAVDARPTLAKIREWWSQIPSSFHIAGVGKVLARSNATRYDTAQLLPQLD